MFFSVAVFCLSSRSLCFVSKHPCSCWLFDSPHCLAHLYCVHQLSYALQHHAQDRERHLAGSWKLRISYFWFVLILMKWSSFIFLSVFCDSPIIHICSYKSFSLSSTVVQPFLSIIVLSWREQKRTINTATVREWIRKKLPNTLLLRGERGDQCIWLII